MQKLQYHLLKLFGFTISELQKHNLDWRTRVTYHVTPKDGRSAQEFLEEHGRKLLCRPWWKKMQIGCFLVCLYQNPFDNPNELRAGIMDSPSQYDMFVKSVNKKERWYDIPFFKLDGNYNCH